jgi:hypothetical protein
MRTILILATAALVAVGLSVAAHAEPAERLSRGDAQAVLSAYPTGGNALFAHAPTFVHAGPWQAGPEDGLSIRPIPPFFTDAHYCAEDWHVVALAWYDVEYVVHFDEPFVYSRNDVRDFLGGLEMEFFLDGEPFATKPGPIQPNPDPAFAEEAEAFLEDLYGADVTVGKVSAIQWGRVVAPDELEVGAHTLSVIVTHPDSGIIYEDGVSFFIDPADSETCAID